MTLFSMKPGRFRIFGCAVLGAALLAGTPAFAKRPIEDAVLKSPRPHESAGGAKIRVHYVSRHTLDPFGPGVSLKALQQSVQQCVASHARGGKQSNPPTSWPEEAAYEGRVDSYYARNRGIAYRHGVQFGLNPIDCSLMELEISEATLYSSYGICFINLKRKTYQGQCDLMAHERAPVTVVPPPQSPSQQAADLARMKANPQMAAMAAAMEGVLATAAKPTGAVKTFDGAKCDVIAGSVPNRSTQCFLRGGSFVPSAQATESGSSKILLEIDTPNGGKEVADRVKLDTEVGASVFTPDLQGFTRPDGSDK